MLRTSYRFRLRNTSQIFQKEKTKLKKIEKLLDGIDVTKYAKGESIEDCGKTGNDETRKPEKKVGCDRNEEHRNQAH